MSTLENNILTASGLDEEYFEQTAYAPVVPREGGRDLPAILVGSYRGNNVAIRAWPVVVDGAGSVMRWNALAFVSAHPGFALNELSNEERERLRAESQVAQGADEPVGQEAVLNQPAPAPAPPPAVPYAPPLPAPAEDLPGDEGVRVEAAACGTEGCMTATDPELGTQTIHIEGCPEFKGD